MGVGIFACSKAGHDKGRIYVIVEIDSQRVFLCDGDRRPLDNPKVKNIKHIQPIKAVPEELRQMCVRNEEFYNEGIKRALKQYAAGAGRD